MYIHTHFPLIIINYYYYYIIFFTRSPKSHLLSQIQVRYIHTLLRVQHVRGLLLRADTAVRRRFIEGNAISDAILFPLVIVSLIKDFYSIAHNRGTGGVTKATIIGFYLILHIHEVHT